MKLVKAKALRPGARIGIIAPAGPLRSEEHLKRAIAYIESRGYRTCIGRSVYKRHLGYLAGEDAERAADLNAMFADPSIDAIFCARGGYGCMRLLDLIDYDLIAAMPKIFVGFSDITALQCALLVRSGLISFSGAMPAVDMRDTFHPESETSFWGMLDGTIDSGELQQSTARQALQPGIARGRLVCGNLTLFAALCGSPWLPLLAEKVLLIEEVAEEPYRVDRMLAQLLQAGGLADIAGLALGQFSAVPEGRSATPQPPMKSTLHDYVHRLQRPTVGNILYGHQALKLTLPFGAMVEVDGSAGRLRLLEAPLN